MVGYSVSFMSSSGFANNDQARGLVCAAMCAAAEMRDGAFWKMLPAELLAFGRRLETLSRVIYATQVHLAGEIDARDMASARSCSSTHSLLRQAFNISSAEAVGRVKAARQMLPREMASGGEAPALLSMLADAVNDGRLGSEHVRTIVETMAKVPAGASPEVRAACESALVSTGVDGDPNFLERAAVLILERSDPDGDLDQRSAAAKMGLDFGSRNIRTGLTPIRGHLDDHGIAVVKTAIEALAAPAPESDGVRDTRSPANRRAHAMVEAMRGFLDAAQGPAHGGERPHVTVTLNWDAVTNAISQARYDTGAHLSPAQARRFLCDAAIIPAILGTDGEVLDVGRRSRTFPPTIRRAVALRDRGCSWPGCDRPPQWCDAHHIQFWGRDLGVTSLANGVLLCPFHHSEIHKEEWRIRMTETGLPEFIPPRWLDPGQRPRRNSLHHNHRATTHDHR